MTVALRPFQQKVVEAILAGKNVILQAPTGSGKTRAAIAPFIANRFRDSKPGADLPPKCVYAVPLRVLATQFYEEYRLLVASYRGKAAALSDDELETADFRVTIQTGEQARDPEFQGDLIFTTIDQLLSNFLGLPYALSTSRANLNCGAVISRYLILDEFHLFPREENTNQGAFITSLLMLRWLKDLTPFVLMTATFSEVMLQTLKEWLGAEVVTLTEHELAELESEQKDRYYHTWAEHLSVSRVLDTHQTRSVVVFNTVARAQLFYLQLLKDERVRSGEIETRLLHSRFTKEHRRKKEAWAMREFGKDPVKREAKSAILVATQVVEVGLDISCQNLHTELAEATSLIQRAGRCARYQGEVGRVYIYRPVNKEGKLQARPYRSQLLEASWKAFGGVNGQRASYKTEMNLVNAVHTETDRTLLNALRSSQRTLENTVKDVMLTRSRDEARKYASELIRQVYNTRVVIHPDPQNAGFDEPWKLEGFSLYTYSLRNSKRFQALVARAKTFGFDKSGIWVYTEETDLTENVRAKPTYRWKEIHNESQLIGYPQIFIHPALAAYDEELGFRLLIDDFADEASGTYQVEPPPKAAAPQKSRYGYKKETYQEHISLLLRAYEFTSLEKRPVSYREEMSWVAARMEQRFKWEKGVIDRAIRLACACHDLGKMSEDWQKWARAWQHTVGQKVTPTEMLAHTFYNYDLHREYEKNARKYKIPVRPPHAVQGAAAVMELASSVLGNEAVGRAVITAIARHHSPDALAADPFKLHGGATGAMREVFEEVGRAADGWQPSTKLIKADFPYLINLDAASKIARSTPDNSEMLLYYLIVRILRLCDVEALRPTE